MSSDPEKLRSFSLFFLIVICSCSGNVMQTTVFSDGFQEMRAGAVPVYDPSDPAVYFNSERGTLGEWTVATSLRQEGFNRAWQIREHHGSKFLAQTFRNLDQQNEPLSLITHPIIVAGDSLWKDITVEVLFTPGAKFDKCGVAFSYQNPMDFYFFGIEGNTVILKRIRQSVTPLRPFEQILEYRPLVWTPGDQFHATVTVRRNKIYAILNDSIRMYVEDHAHQQGRIALISDNPARFHSVKVKLLRGEQRKLNRRRRQLARRVEIQLSDHPGMVRWKVLKTAGYGTDQNIRLGDLTGDGNKELVLVRPDQAKENTVAAITAVNLHGELLWQFGDTGKRNPGKGDELPVQIHDLDGDGQREVIFVSGGWIHLLDGKTGEMNLRRQVPGNSRMKSMIFGDLHGIGRDNCVILSDRQNRLMVMNEELEVMWQQTMKKGSHPMVFDIDQDGCHEVLMGYSVFSHSGDLMMNLGEFIGDRCNGVSVIDLYDEESAIPCLIYASGDWGIIYFGFNGNLLKQNIMGHVQYLSIADFNREKKGLEVITSNRWGSNGLLHAADASGHVIRDFMSQSGVSRCVPVNWKGDGEEFFMLSADTLSGGMYNSRGELAVEFPSDGHPVTCYMIQDLTGDARDEVLVWNKDEVWIYTQDDNPRMGKTYAPRRIPLYNYSTHQMNLSQPDW